MQQLKAKNLMTNAVTNKLERVSTLNRVAPVNILKYLLVVVVVVVAVAAVAVEVAASASASSSSSSSQHRKRAVSVKKLDG
jgi:hypothetical protein